MATCTATSESAAVAVTRPASSRRLDRENQFRPRVAARGSADVLMSTPSVCGPRLGPSYRLNTPRRALYSRRPFAMSQPARARSGSQDARAHAARAAGDDYPGRWRDTGRDVRIRRPVLGLITHGAERRAG